MNINKQNHKKRYSEEWNVAKKTLKKYPGNLEWISAPYQAFRYKSHDVCLIFYPHKTSAENYHVRIRNQNSKNEQEADRLMRELDTAAGNNCTFTKKI